jgi:hypothetical protein
LVHTKSSPGVTEPDADAAVDSVVFFFTVADCLASLTRRN